MNARQRRRLRRARIREFKKPIHGRIVKALLVCSRHEMLDKMLVDEDQRFLAELEAHS